MKADIGVIGLAVMGQNIILNMADHGFTVAVFNRTSSKVEDFLKGEAKGKSIVGSNDLSHFIKQLKKPRRIMLMIKAGAPVDECIEQLTQYLDSGDIIIDGGNSYYLDTERRLKNLKEKGILYVGAGVSGGEEGARHGPSIMPGGSEEAWPHIRPIFQAIAARSEEGEICSEWVGPGGSGHFVKMVHNGIEYGDMQLISESYDFMHRGLNISHAQLSTIFAEWDRWNLNSYLIEITATILQKLDTDSTPLVEKILDVAGQKGTGKWTVSSGLDFHIPITLINEAVLARTLSGFKEERMEAEKIYAIPKENYQGDSKKLSMQMALALYASKIVSYAQGFMLLKKASDENHWNLNLGSIALLWRGGCIIRSRFLGKIKEAYDRNPKLTNLLVDSYFSSEMKKCHLAWREVVAIGAMLGIPLPCMGAGLSFFDGYRSSRLPANLLQAQRDFFGAHMYERIDRARGEFFHTNWTGQGGDVSSSQYSV